MTAAALPDLAGHFGRYGGRFVPEALVKALDELDAAYRSAKTDPVFQERFTGLLRDARFLRDPRVHERGIKAWERMLAAAKVPESGR